MNKQIKNLIHLIVPLFVLHLIEEAMTHSYVTDPHINLLAKYIGYTPQSTFLFVQILLFILLALVLISFMYYKNDALILVSLVAIVCLYEFSRLYTTVKNLAYTPGVVTGVILGILGILLVKELFTEFKEI